MVDEEAVEGGRDETLSEDVGNRKTTAAEFQKAWLPRLTSANRPYPAFRAIELG